MHTVYLFSFRFHSSLSIFYIYFILYIFHIVTVVLLSNLMPPDILSPISISHVENIISHDSNVNLVNSSISSLGFDKLTCSQIRTLLKAKPNEYVILDNAGKHMSSCWTLFGFPAVVDYSGRCQRINGFVLCQKCFSTYSFVSDSTRYLNQHNCDTAKEKEIASKQRHLTSFYLRQQINLTESEIMKIKNLQAEWICQSIRPFSIVDDEGLHRLVQECISIGEYE